MNPSSSSDSIKLEKTIEGSLDRRPLKQLEITCLIALHYPLISEHSFT